MGIASSLLDQLEKIARENNYKGFVASVLKENVSMLHVFRKKYPHAETIITSGTEIDVVMDFSDAIKEKPNPSIAP
jgi:ribosomal protein S18 acetylase RimI-like enzyme